MQIETVEKRLAPQKCMYCGELQDIIVNGMDDCISPEGEPSKEILSDVGYSFCNCKNFFFTNWENMNQGIYNIAYQQKYKATNADEVVRGYRKFFPMFQELAKGRNFLEIGCSYTFAMDTAVEHGFKTQGVNISPVEFTEHPVKVGDFETVEMYDKYDVIYATHVFEHFKDPLKAAKKCHDMLNDNGCLFVVMPDPYFIDWTNPYFWGHWHIREHHTLWDMESFCDELEKIGFKTIEMQRSFDSKFIYCGEFAVLLQKVAK